MRDIVDKINHAYLEQERFGSIGGGENISCIEINYLLNELCARPITTFEDTMISAAKQAAGREDKEYSVLSIRNILSLMNERKVYDAYDSDFKNTKKEICDILQRELKSFKEWEKKHQNRSTLECSEDGE